MKLVIDINEELYEQAIRDKNYHDVTGLNDINDYSLTIAQGIPYDERPQGEWLLLRTNYEDSGNNFYECTNCHYSDIHADSAEVPYCWHCGSKMKGGTE